MRTKVSRKRFMNCFAPGDYCMVSFGGEKQDRWVSHKTTQRIYLFKKDNVKTHLSFEKGDTYYIDGCSAIIVDPTGFEIKYTFDRDLTFWINH
jgi:hypothetical protein